MTLAPGPCTRLFIINKYIGVLLYPTKAIQFYERMPAVKESCVNLEVKLPYFQRSPVRDARKSMLVLGRTH